ncbi:Auxin-responsive protein [Thalictrum thalictroides]|uniref:Auxin-responsive protein n=1 Tax=Thalictrum thalictroides TaxID=46969 RepID=A0A7J6VHW1_THATH|nr:Auxin-responsive protein [Thalictrum thalictroides]
MEGGFKNKEGCPQLLDLIYKDREWLMRSDEKSLGVSEEKKLELRLGPPGEEDETSLETSLSSHFYQNKFSSSVKQQLGSAFTTTWCTNPSVYQMKTLQQQPNNSSYHQFPSLPQTLPVKGMESSNTCKTKGVGEQSQTEKKACSQPSATVPANTAVNNNSSQKRSAPAPVVGWPPVRSFRKNLASSTSSKQVQDSQNEDPPKEINTKQESCGKGMFVKINMDGVPIGRKVDLKAYNSYEKLSSAVDKLFRDLLAAQRDSPVTGNHSKVEDVKEITGLLDGSGEYTLVYEDNEGDRMLVGDVPWDMFATAVKRLRVLKSSELSTLRVGSGKQGRQPQ